MSDDLKPYPFCSGNNLLTEPYYDESYVRCQDCKAEGPTGTYDQCGELWNKRKTLFERGIMSKSFAKLFETEYGQILVIIDEGKGGPEISVKLRPPGLTVCTTTLKFLSWNEAQAAFDGIDKEIESATSWVKGLFAQYIGNIPACAETKVGHEHN